MLRGMWGRLRIGQDVEFLRTTDTLELHGDGIPFQVDGDLGGVLEPERPVRLWLDHHRARLFARPAMIPR